MSSCTVVCMKLQADAKRISRSKSVHSRLNRFAPVERSRAGSGLQVATPLRKLEPSRCTHRRSEDSYQFTVADKVAPLSSGDRTAAKATLKYFIQVIKGSYMQSYRWEKNILRRSMWGIGFPVTFSNLSSNASSTSWLPNCPVRNIQPAVKYGAG